jgi:hypothetical protein
LGQDDILKIMSMLVEQLRSAAPTAAAATTTAPTTPTTTPLVAAAAAPLVVPGAPVKQPPPPKTWVDVVVSQPVFDNDKVGEGEEPKPKVPLMLGGDMEHTERFSTEAVELGELVIVDTNMLHYLSSKYGLKISPTKFMKLYQKTKTKVLVVGVFYENGAQKAWLDSGAHVLTQNTHAQFNLPPKADHRPLLSGCKGAIITHAMAAANMALSQGKEFKVEVYTLDPIYYPMALASVNLGSNITLVTVNMDPYLANVTSPQGHVRVLNQQEMDAIMVTAQTQNKW